MERTRSSFNYIANGLWQIAYSTMKKNNESIFTFSNLSQISGLVHGISTKKYNGMQTGKKKTIIPLIPFLEDLNIAQEKIVGMYQVHSNIVKNVSRKDAPALLSDTDGLLTNERDLFLFGGFADCVPVLFYDTKTHRCGIVHSGWRGTYEEIVVRMIEKMQSEGASVQDIIVGIGPSIRGCCYDIDKKRFLSFKEKFPQVEKYVQKKEGKYFLDLAKLIAHQLKTQGVLEEHIEDAQICTSDESERFYSYRKTENKGNIKTFAAIIGRV